MTHIKHLLHVACCRYRCQRVSRWVSVLSSIGGEAKMADTNFMMKFSGVLEMSFEIICMFNISAEFFFVLVFHWICCTSQFAVPLGWPNLYLNVIFPAKAAVERNFRCIEPSLQRQTCKLPLAILHHYEPNNSLNYIVSFCHNYPCG